jgi:CHAT domain-containing protein
MSDQYEAALERFYHPQAIANELIRFQDKKIRMLEVTWQNVPLASLIGKHHSLSLSTLATHERNERAAFRKILIWCDPLQDLRTSSYEKESIETICRAHNIRCESVSGDECTVDGFLHKYADEEYDLIWVICHGNFDYDDYFNSELVVSRHGAVTLEQVKRLTPAGSKRRLLVLNSCQSACSTVRYDGMGFVGFGTQLANQAQSVIGHLWPVSQMAASIFGAVLMGNLVLQSSWEAALNKTRKDLVNPLSSARSLLSGYLPENNKLIQELEEHSTLLSKLFFWGSASLFE